MDTGEMIALLMEDIHTTAELARGNNDSAQGVMVQLQQELLEILEPAEWWIENVAEGDSDSSDHITGYAYFPCPDVDTVNIMLWSLHRLTRDELRRLVDVLGDYSSYEYGG